MLIRGGVWVGVLLCGVTLSGCSSSDGPTGVGTAAKVAFIGSPITAVAGSVITPAVQVAVQDAQGNTVTTSTTSITVAIGANPAGGTLSGTTTVAAVSGVATFANLSLNPAGTGYTLTASATGLTGATSSSVAVSAGGGSVVATLFGAPTWVAVQDGNGPWTRVLPNPGTTTYQFSLPSGKGGLALVTVVGPYTLLEVRYESLAEFTAQLSGDFSRWVGSRTVNGSVANVGPADLAQVSLGLGFALLSPGFGTFPLFQITDVGAGPLDLVAARYPVNGTMLTSNGVIVRRALSPANNSTLPLLDFDAEGFVPDSADVTVTGLAGDTLFVLSAFVTQGAAFGTLSYTLSFLADPGAQPFRAVPLAQLNATDVQFLTASAQRANDFRGASLVFRNPLNQTLALGPYLSTPSVTNVVTAPNVRPRVQLASQAEYNGSILAEFAQGTLNRAVIVSASAGYYGGVPATWDVTVPDLSAAAGWSSAWGLQDGTPIDYWGVGAGSGILYLDSATVGSTERSAAKSSSTALPVSALRTGLDRFLQNRRLLDALRSRMGFPSPPNSTSR